MNGDIPPERQPGSERGRIKLLEPENASWAWDTRVSIIPTKTETHEVRVGEGSVGAERNKCETEGKTAKTQGPVRAEKGAGATDDWEGACTPRDPALALSTGCWAAFLAASTCLPASHLQQAGRGQSQQRHLARGCEWCNTSALRVFSVM